MRRSAEFGVAVALAALLHLAALQAFESGVPVAPGGAGAPGATVSGATVTGATAELTELIESWEEGPDTAEVQELAAAAPADAGPETPAAMAELKALSAPAAPEPRRRMNAPPCRRAPFSSRAPHLPRICSPLKRCRRHRSGSPGLPGWRSDPRPTGRSPVRVPPRRRRPMPSRRPMSCRRVSPSSSRSRRRRPRTRRGPPGRQPNRGRRPCANRSRRPPSPRRTRRPSGRARPRRGQLGRARPPAARHLRVGAGRLWSNPPCRPGAGGGAAAGAPAAAEIEDARQEWLAEVRRAVEREKKYPRQVERRGIAGQPTVRITVDESGRLTGATLAGSSGEGLIDEAAISAVRSVGRYPPIPPEMREASVTITLPFDFRRRWRPAIGQAPSGY